MSKISEIKLLIKYRHTDYGSGSGSGYGDGRGYGDGSGNGIS